MSEGLAKEIELMTAVDEMKASWNTQVEVCKQMAKLYKAQYTACIVEGFTPEQALQVTMHRMTPS